MNILPEKGTREYAIADALSRDNTLNGLYKKLDLPLEWNDLNTKDPIYITHVANLADRIIQEAIDNGKDLNSDEVKKEIQVAFHGGSSGASIAIIFFKILRFFGFNR